MRIDLEGMVFRFSGNDSDQDFEPTAEMMVDDFDDERTMAEEEELEGGDEEEDDELELLKNEQDMPIDKLMSLQSTDGPHLMKKRTTSLAVIPKAMIRKISKMMVMSRMAKTKT